jgi:NhaP-type Na+/H+ or K+/H+ antiporter
VLLGPALKDLTWSVGLYAVLSLTVVRMIPVAFALIGSGARPPTVAFVGWFGPRGLASIVFAVMVLDDSTGLPGVSTILLATYVTIGLSVLLHGLTAAPLAGRYAAWFSAHAAGQAPVMESAPAKVPRVRGPLRGVPGDVPPDRSR